MKIFNKIFLLSIIAGLACTTSFAMQDDEEKQSDQKRQLEAYRKTQKKKWERLHIPATTTEPQASTSQTIATPEESELQAAVLKKPAVQKTEPTMEAISSDDYTLFNVTIPYIIGTPKTTADLFNAIKELVRLRNTSRARKYQLNNERIAQVLKEAGFDINDPIDNLENEAKGFTPLQVAVRNNNAGIVKILLMLGADVNLTVKCPGNAWDGMPALKIAVDNRRKRLERRSQNKKSVTDNLDILRVLMEKGAKPSPEWLLSIVTGREGSDLDLIEIFLNAPTGRCFDANVLDKALNLRLMKGDILSAELFLEYMSKLIKEGAEDSERLKEMVDKYKKYTE